MSGKELIRKSIVARDYRRVCTRQLHTLIQQGKWPPPDVPAKERGQADYYFRSTAERARDAFINSATDQELRDFVKRLVDERDSKSSAI